MDEQVAGKLPGGQTSRCASRNVTKPEARAAIGPGVSLWLVMPAAPRLPLRPHFGRLDTSPVNDAAKKKALLQPRWLLKLASETSRRNRVFAQPQSTSPGRLSNRCNGAKRCQHTLRHPSLRGVGPNSPPSAARLHDCFPTNSVGKEGNCDFPVERASCPSDGGHTAVTRKSVSMLSRRGGKSSRRFCSPKPITPA